MTAAEISEIITHLAFYSGWGTAMSAVEVGQPIFARRSVLPATLPGAAVAFLDIDETAEAQRAAMAEQSAGKVAPRLVQFTMDNGLTQAQASEVITHLAFYAGWPNAFSSVPVVKDVFERHAQ